MKPLVRDLMTRDVKVIRENRGVHELEKLLLRQGVHGVPVVDAARRIVGVVSQSDLLAWHFEISDVRTASVSEVMSPLVHCIGPDKPIAEAAARMVRERIHRLIVVDDAYAVLGILSAVDVLRAVPDVESRLAGHPRAS